MMVFILILFRMSISTRDQMIVLLFYAIQDTSGGWDKI